MVDPARTRGLIEETSLHQARAADPAASAWVTANAGAGKTYVLSRRVLRLLLSGIPLSHILCVTYTKAAAAEMEKRVLDVLAGWSIAPDEKLAAALKDLTGEESAAREKHRARTLFAHVIEAPGGLRAETLHAFAERLIRRCPVEAGVPPGYSILDEGEARALEREAIGQVLAEAGQDADSPLAAALAGIARYAGDESFEDLIHEALSERRWLEEACRLAPASGAPASGPGAVYAFYCRLLGARPEKDLESLNEELAAVMPLPDLQGLAAALQGGAARDREGAARVAAALSAPDNEERIAALQAFFCTGQGEARKNLATTAVTAANKALLARATAAQERFLALLHERTALEVATATSALLEVAAAVMARYQAAKARRAALDFEDLIARASRLLVPAPHDPRAHFTDWVLYKLDGGLTHILVDEAQDMSARQWEIVEALAGRLFDGKKLEGRSGSLFAVGDEKQSIYGFQGAAPAMFAGQGQRFAALAGAAGQEWRTVPLTLSFRTVSPILAAVDEVFKDGTRTPGLSAAGAAVRHAACRSGQGGLIEIWPPETGEETEETSPWDPLGEQPVVAPAARLVQRIVRTLTRWFGEGERLASANRPVRPGDILILVRKRQPFAAPMVAALKAAGIPVAGADRIRLLSEIAVLDLIALGEALLQPEDDLSLAAVLKSPLFGFGDEELFSLAYGRKGSLWSALAEGARTNPRFKEAALFLRRWRMESARRAPFEFYAGVLDGYGMRARMLTRLGTEAADPINEFLNLALECDREAPPSLRRFLSEVRESGREIKRDMEEGEDAVRVMTVHGAKGLEAPIVFLPDTCGGPGGNAPALLPLTGTQSVSTLPDPLVWAIKNSGRHALVQTARDARRAQENEEQNRLLYVAMTRARDRLYIGGFEGRRGRPKGCWYNLIFDALAPQLTPVTLADGTQAWRRESPQAGPHEIARHPERKALQPEAPPEWAQRRAPPEMRLSLPFAPSRLVAYETGREGEESGTSTDKNVAVQLPAAEALAAARGGNGPAAETVENEGNTEKAEKNGKEDADAVRFLGGTLAHALLEHLPAVPPERREEAALAFLARRGRGLSGGARQRLVREVLALLSDPAFSAVFGPESCAEVPVAARLPRPAGRKGPPLEISGQIDRLVIADGRVLIIDYKTNRQPPESVNDIPEAYLFQLAAYRLALAEIFPAYPVCAAILWTAGPRLMEIPVHTLDLYKARLFALDPARVERELEASLE